MPLPEVTIVTPGPSGASLARALLLRRADAIAFFRSLIERYGSVVRMQLGKTSIFIVSDAAWVRHVLVDRAKNYSKGQYSARLRPVLGDGLITSGGDLWRSQRRLIQPAFAKDRLGLLTDRMIAVTEGHLDGWRAPASIDVADDMMDLSLHIVARTLLGADLAGNESIVARALADVVAGLEAQAVSPARLVEMVPILRDSKRVRRAVDALPTRANRRLAQAIADLDALVYGVIRERARRRDAATDDVLSMLLGAGADASAPMPERQVRDEVMTLILAGHETVATGLAWSLYALARDPSAQRRARLEVVSVIRDRPLATEDVPKLAYVRAVTEESLRLYPPVWRITRRSEEEDVVAGHHVPPKSLIVLLPYFTQRSAEYWTDPERFDPHRWLGDRDPPRGAYFPFGLGTRTCIGASFAVTESVVVLAAVLRRFELELVDREHPAFLPRITLRPRGGLVLRVSPAAS